MKRHLWHSLLAFIGGIAMFQIKWPLTWVPVDTLRALGSSGLYALQMLESFVVAAAIGAILARLLKWRFKELAIVAVPSFLMVWFPLQVSIQAQKAGFGPEYNFPSYFVNHLQFFAPYVVGALLGAAAVRFMGSVKGASAA